MTVQLVGSQAKAQLLRNAQNTVTDFRNLLGKQFKDVESSASPHRFQSCPLVAQSDSPAYTLHHTDPPTTLPLITLASRYLDNIRKSAVDFLGRPITGAVFAVPPSFNDAQKKAIEEAAAGAGLKVLQLINEPTAAVLAASTQAEEGSDAHSADKNIVVVDIGGTSLTTSVLGQKGGISTLLHSSTDNTLGGAALDTVIVEHLAKEFQKTTQVDVKTDKRGMVKLRLEAEQVKRALSRVSTATASVESLSEGLDLHATVNRTRFELLASKTFGAIVSAISAALKHAGLDVIDVDEVLLVGGSARIPKLQQRIRDLFYQPEAETKEQKAEEGKVARRTSKTIVTVTTAPDELIACGCAIQGSLIAAFDEKDVQESLHPVVTVSPHLTKPLGVLDGQGAFVTILSQDTPLPVRRSVQFAIPTGESKVHMPIYEGKHAVHEIAPPPKEEKAKGAADDDEDDYDDDEDFEQAPLRIPVTKQDQLVAEVVMPVQAAPESKKKGAPAHTVEVTLQVDAAGKLSIVARELGVQKGSIVKVEAK